MPNYTVRQGDCLSSIAHRFGLPDWRTIYDDARNAAFRARRPDPNLIYPGDLLWIPDLRPREESVPTDARHVFVCEFPPVHVNLCIEDARREALGGARWELALDSGCYEGRTDDSGWVRCEVPGWSERGTLKVWLDDTDPEAAMTWPIALGHLDPMDTEDGLRDRLGNLNYDCGDAGDGEALDASVRRFQAEHGLIVDGIVGPRTRAALQRAHRI